MQLYKHNATVQGKAQLVKPTLHLRINDTQPHRRYTTGSANEKSQTKEQGDPAPAHQQYATIQALCKMSW
jgi:hypothetical protein